jgi:hypothetical protein
MASKKKSAKRSSKPAPRGKPAKKKTATKKAATKRKSATKNKLAVTSFAATSTVFRALCRRDDFEGPQRDTKPEARQDAVAHQTSKPGHIVDVIEEQASG